MTDNIRDALKHARETHAAATAQRERDMARGLSGRSRAEFKADELRRDTYAALLDVAEAAEQFLVEYNRDRNDENQQPLRAALTRFAEAVQRSQV